MRAVVVGPGRLGTTLAVALEGAGHEVVACAGGGPGARERFTTHLPGAEPVDAPATVADRVGLILLTPPDDALEGVVRELAVADVLRERHRVVHTSGVRGLDVLRPAALAGAGTAACHPAQAVPAGPPDPDLLAGAAWAVTAAPGDRDWARGLVEGLGGVPHDLRDADRVLYHAALALASNSAAAAVAAARQLLLGARVDDPAAFLEPLVRASVGNVLDEGAAALTGPVVRGDAGTVGRHLEALEADLPELAGTYRRLTAAVLDLTAAGLDEDAARRLRRLLEEGPTPPAGSEQ